MKKKWMAFLLAGSMLFSMVLPALAAGGEEEADEDSKVQQIQSDATIIDSGVCGNDLEWTLDAEGLLRISGRGDMEDYNDDTAPWDTYFGIITAVEIEEGVTSIGANAFMGYDLLESVTLPKGLERIGEKAFQFCEGLTEVTIPASVEQIDEDAFASCAYLSAFHVEEGNRYYMDQNGVLLSQDGTELLYYPGGKTAAKYTVPNRVTRVGNAAFSGCMIHATLEEVVLPDGVTEIGDHAFYACMSLTSITIPDSVQSIGEYAFYATGLSTVTLPVGLKSIGVGAFDECENLTEIRYRGCPEEWEELLEESGVVLPDTIEVVCEATAPRPVEPTPVTPPASSGSGDGGGAFLALGALLAALLALLLKLLQNR